MPKLTKRIIAIEKNPKGPIPRGCSFPVVFRSEDQLLYLHKEQFKPVMHAVLDRIRLFEIFDRKVPEEFHFVLDETQYEFKKSIPFMDLTDRIDLPPLDPEHQGKMKGELKSLEDPEYAREALEKVLERSSGNLTYKGWARDGTPIDPTKGHLKEFVDCCQFLSMCEKSNKMYKGTSYGLKHVVEAWKKDTRPGEDYYISNGMFIAAMIHMDFAPEKLWKPESLNVSGFISPKSLVIAQYG